MAGANAVNALPSAGVLLVASTSTAIRKETAMPQIGEFIREKTGFVGRIELLVPLDRARRFFGSRLHLDHHHDSGSGRELGRWGADEFVNKKLIRIGA